MIKLKPLSPPPPRTGIRTHLSLLRLLRTLLILLILHLNDLKRASSGQSGERMIYSNRNLGAQVFNLEGRGRNQPAKKKTWICLIFSTPIRTAIITMAIDFLPACIPGLCREIIKYMRIRVILVVSTTLAFHPDR